MGVILTTYDTWDDPPSRANNPTFILGQYIYIYVHIFVYMGVSLNGGTPKTPQNDRF